MTIRAGAAACILLLASTFAASASGGGEHAADSKQAEVEPLPVQERSPSSPIEMVRTLQLIQDQIAFGSTNAHVGQRALLSRIDEAFDRLDDSTWKDPKNVRAAVTYVLSGGRPEILKKILNSSSVDAKDEPLVKGALHYVQGREEDARNALLDIDLGTLPVTLAGQIALVQAALVVAAEPARAAQLLDQVRLLAPGTLLEEAALRREVLVVGQIGDIKKFESLVSQYLHRYRNSVYAGNFRQRLAAIVTRLDFGRDSAHFARLVAMLSRLDVEGQRDLYLMVARAAVDRGQTQAAILAADKALALSTDDRVNAARARLYKAAAVIVTAEGFAVGVDDLKKLDRAALPPQDVPLLDSALALAQQIRSAPASQGGSASPAPASGKPDAAKGEQPLPAVSKAKDALSKVDQLMKRKPGE